MSSIGSVRGGALRLRTPIGDGVLLLQGLTGREALSQLFRFELDLVAEKERAIPFDRLVGAPMTVELDAPGGTRYFHGICSRFSQGATGTTLTTYRAQVVPPLWLLSLTRRSRVFARRSVPEILRQVLGADARFALTADYPRREYVVQYRESDLDFAARLMEDEGIFFFFAQHEQGQQLVVGDSPQAHADAPLSASVPFDRSAGRDAAVVFEWEKAQELRAGRYSLRDRNFQLPSDTVEAVASLPDTVQVGAVSHELLLPANDSLEVYDYPGGYAQRFDGVDQGGGDQPAELDKVFGEGRRSVRVRMEEQAAASLRARGASTARGFAPGHSFSLERHGDASGRYVLTSVEHSAQARDASRLQVSYSNAFECIPAGLPYRPPRATPRPSVAGVQTAVVVGPTGSEVFGDKYGRVKVQFHWDREGKRDQSSSCWVRVSHPWADPSGIFHIPRIGDEVVVAFEAGDPDRPIIVGSLPNPQGGGK